MSAVTLMQGDCCEKLNGIPAHSVNLVLADPPYGITHQAWDTVHHLCSSNSFLLDVSR